MALVTVVGALVVALCLCAGTDAQGQAQAQLQVGFYAQSCPQAEVIVRDVVGKAVSANVGLAAGLVRLHFHDCFVQGCDASVLLDSTANSMAEKDAVPNRSLRARGFEVIDDAKTRLESACARTVSCADILAFAARDSVVLTGGSPYAVPAGRRDGNVSVAFDAVKNLPSFTADVAQLTQAFLNKSLSQEDMVTLSGAHTIGVAHCSSFSGRLQRYNATTGTGQDPSMDAATAARLAARCRAPPPPGNPDDAAVVAMDAAGSPDEAFDTGYFRALLAHQGVLASDQTLTSDNATAALVADYASNIYLFVNRFGDAMVRMGRIGVLTGRDGQIRANCRVVNS